MSAARADPVVVFLPGFMQPGGAWEPVAGQLDQRYPSLLLEHGASDFEGRLAEIAEAGEGAVLCGYSLGGRLALHAALRSPGRYRALACLGTSPGIESPAERAERASADERLAAWIESVPIEETVAFWERLPIFSAQSQELVEAQRPGRLAQEPAGLASILRTAGQGVLAPVWDRLAELQLPTLALAGADDAPYARAAVLMAGIAPRGSSATIADAGHAAHLQRPAEFAGLLADFLDENL